MGLLFANGTLVTADSSLQADLLVEGEQIVQMGINLPRADHTLVDVTDKLVMPGGVDVHTHFDLPVSGTHSSDDFATGGRAAAFGGTTTHIDFAIQSRGGTLREALYTWLNKAIGNAVIDYGLHMTITDLRDDVVEEIPVLLDAGIPSLKLLMAYKGSVQVDDSTLFRVMQIAARNEMLVMTHCENGDAIYALQRDHLARGETAPMYHAASRPAVLEAEATNRAIALSEVAGCNLYIVHMTCAGSVEALRAARARSLPVMGETCVQYLFLTESDLMRSGFEGAKFVCSPPLRSEVDHAALWAALHDGTLQVVSTDHCPFWYEGGREGRLAGKELGLGDFTKIPNGIPVVEERLKLLWTYGVRAERFDPSRFVALTSTNPARAFGLYPRKGSLLPGTDADIVVWDPDTVGVISAQTQHMNTDYSVFEGMSYRGTPEQVYLRGRLIVNGNEWLGEGGYGQYLPRGTGTPVL